MAGPSKTHHTGALFVLSLVAALTAAGLRSSAAWQTAASHTAASVSVTYSEDFSNITNPERGFYRQRAPMWLGTARGPLANENFHAIRAEGITMLRAYYVVDEFVDSPLSAEMLAALNADFTAIRNAGFKIIPRFAYNFPQAWPEVPPDAPLARVLQHIDQLTPVLQANADVIAFMEVGFAGAWGEWHNSTNNLIAADHSANDNSSAIVSALLNALPPTRSVALRYPYHKQALFGSASLTDAEAFSGSARSRVGAHNDCFLLNAVDGGTYAIPPDFRPTIEALKSFLHQDNRYVPQGGETCGADGEAQQFIGCGNALTDLARMRWSTMNLEYHPDVVSHWQTQGCLDEIQRRLGYRLRLLSSELPSEVRQRRTLTMAFTITNSGFASPYNPRDVELILRNTGTGAIHRFPLAIDPRRWGAGETHGFTATVTLPQDVGPATYGAFLNLPDVEPTLRNRPEYSIRLANTGTWEASTGFNSLLRTVTVTPPQPFTDPTLTPGVSQVRAVHVLELRTRIDAVRATHGLSPYLWTDGALSGVAIKRTHLVELRAALDAAYIAAGATAPTYTDPDILSFSTPIRAAHITELRSAVVALE